MQMAMKLLEKDIHEKQDLVVALRKQLEDVKQLNLGMHKKHQVLLMVLPTYLVYQIKFRSVGGRGKIQDKRERKR